VAKPPGEQSVYGAQNGKPFFTDFFVCILAIKKNFRPIKKLIAKIVNTSQGEPKLTPKKIFLHDA